MARSVGKGILGFGMVNVPVKLHSVGNSSAKVSFKLLSPDGNRLKQQYIEDGVQDPRVEQAIQALKQKGIDPDDVPDILKDRPNVIVRKDMLKGYEYTKGEFVTFEQDEIKALSEPSSPNIGIEEFVPVESVPPHYIEKSYYLTPDNGGAKAYSLLSRGLAATGRVGLAPERS